MTETPAELNMELEEVNRGVKNTHATMIELNREGFKTSRDFYNHLSLMSSGVISLSITFVGYLVGLEGFIIKYPELLIVGWLALLLCLLSSIYRNHFHSNMLHWQINKKFGEKKIIEQEWILKALRLAPSMFANLRNQSQVTNYRDMTTQQLAQYQKDIKFLSRKEKISNFLWVGTQQVAHITFGVGITLIVIFATLNLPVKYEVFENILKILNNA